MLVRKGYRALGLLLEVVRKGGLFRFNADMLTHIWRLPALKPPRKLAEKNLKGAEMGFLAFCGMVYVVAITAWGAIKSKDERQKLAAEFKEKPGQSIFVLVWVTAAFMFVVGIFAPVFGESEFFDTGWEIWQVGGVVFFGFWVVTLFWRIG